MQQRVGEYSPLRESSVVELQASGVKPVDRVKLVNYTVEQVANLPFQLITAYDNRGISTALAGFIVKTNLGTDAVTTDHLSQELMLLVLGIRIALTLVNVASESTTENKRYKKELKRKKKIDERYQAMYLDYLGMLEKVQAELERGIIPNWSDYNSLIFSSVIRLYSENNRRLSEQEEHLFYSALRMAIPFTHIDDVTEKFNDFKKENSKDTREALLNSVNAGLAARVKPTSVIKNKKIRSLLRNLKRFGDFIMANATGLSLVTILASYIAILPFITVIMFYVYIAAVIIGIVFASLKIIRDVMERKHQKIAGIESEEKKRYQQSQTMKKLLDKLEESSLEVKDNSVRPVNAESSNDNNAIAEKSRERPSIVGGSLGLRVFITIPITAAVSSVSGWWAVTTLSGAVAGLGGPALAGTALAILPPISAVIVTLFALAKSLSNVYREYHVEQEDICALEKECKIQEDRIQSSTALKAVSELSDAQLLRCYISEFLNQAAKNSDKTPSKDVLHNVQKIIGAKRSESINKNAFYGYLAAKMLSDPDCAESEKTQVLTLVSQLKAYLDEEDFISIKCPNKEIDFSQTFLKKGKSGWQLFVDGFDTFCATIMPVILGLGFAVAFVSGPAYPIVAVGMIFLLGVLSYVNAQIQKGYTERKTEREQLRAKMAVCDETAGFLMKSGHEIPQQKQPVKAVKHAPDLSFRFTKSVSPVSQQDRFFPVPRGISDENSPRREAEAEIDSEKDKGSGRGQVWTYDMSGRGQVWTYDK